MLGDADEADDRPPLLTRYRVLGRHQTTLSRLERKIPAHLALPVALRFDDTLHNSSVQLLEAYCDRGGVLGLIIVRLARLLDGRAIPFTLTGIIGGY